MQFGWLTLALSPTPDEDARRIDNLIDQACGAERLGFSDVWLTEHYFTGESVYSDSLMFAAALAASLVAGSHMFTHDFSPLILAMFLGAASSSGSAGKALVWPRFAMSISLVLFWAFPVYFLFVAWHCLFLLCPVLVLFTWAALSAAHSIKRQTDENVLQPVVAG